MTPTCFGQYRPSSGSIMKYMVKLLDFIDVTYFSMLAACPACRACRITLILRAARNPLSESHTCSYKCLTRPTVWASHPPPSLTDLIKLPVWTSQNPPILLASHDLFSEPQTSSYQSPTRRLESHTAS